MSNACRRCISTASRSLFQQPSSSSSQPRNIIIPDALKQKLEKTPIIPDLPGVEPETRAHLQRHFRAAALSRGADPAEVYGTEKTAAAAASISSSTSSKSPFDDIAISLEPRPSGSSPSSSFSSFPPPAPTSSSSSTFPPSSVPTRTFEIPPLEDPLIGFLTNLMMKDGKKTRARKHVELVLTTLRTRSNQLPMSQLREAIRLASPSIRMTQQKRMGKAIAVPIALGERQSVHKAIEWILEASDKRKNPNSGGSKKFGERVALELEAILNGTSDVLKKKEQLHIMATVNRSNVIAASRR